ncbi:hypothetical protein [Legionella tunisiensis]|uniref:hypothetical protein n=1 Tax=Legionella tunisiensis TaxID=1034944 RepID=UPI0002E4BED1|nr:hypothetical protein [Legionella tunisiensis]
MADDGRWELRYNVDTKQFDFSQLEAIQHPDSNDNNDNIIIEVTATLTRTDGASASSQFLVTIYDDGPKITGTDDLLVDETGDLKSVTGLLTKDFGADVEGAVVKFTAENAEWDVETRTLTDNDGYWKLVYNAQSEDEYQFTQLKAIPHADTLDNNDFLE